MVKVFAPLAALVITLGLAAPAAADDVFSWGGNFSGELGDGTTTHQSAPVPVDTTGVLAGKRITDLGSGPDAGHACVIAEGRAYCWGENTSGKLGDGTTTNRIRPIAVDAVLAGKRVTAVAAGGDHTCVLADGTPYCWGENSDGQLGDGTTIDRGAPTPVNTSGALAGKQITTITAGAVHTCVLADGRPYCWGGNPSGQVGDGTTIDRSNPGPVWSASGGIAGKAVTALDAGVLHTCVVADGQAFCWGRNADGALGDGTNTNRTIPVPVNTSGALAARTVTAISASAHTCVVADAKPFCWGLNTFGQLGDGTQTQRTEPTLVNISGVLAGRSVQAITAGELHTCAVADQKVSCWGRNEFGSVGKGSLSTTEKLPVDVVGLAPRQPRLLEASDSSVYFLAAQAPTAPRDPWAQVATRAVTVSWAAPLDDGGRAVTTYLVTTEGGSCQTTGTSCTLTGLTPGGQYTVSVVARNAIGDSPATTVAAVVPKARQSFAVPKRIKKRGVTVLVKKRAKTSAGAWVKTTVKTKGKVKVIRKKGGVKVRTFGKKPRRVVLTQTAPGTATHEPFSQKVVYKKGKRS